MESQMNKPFPAFLFHCLALLVFLQWDTTLAVCPKSCACRDDVIMCQRGDWADIQPAIKFGLERLILEKDVKGLNTLKSTSLINCETLKMLKINSLSLQTIEANTFDRCAALVDLDLNSNRLAVLDVKSFAGLSNLKSLKLAKNKLSSFEQAVFAPLVGLKTLDLSHNHGLTIQPNAFATCTALVDLNLSNNGMANLATESFAGLSELRSLNLANNKLSSLVTVFSPLVGLKTLDLTHNMIQDLSKPVFKTQAALTVLNLSGNRFNRLTSQTFVGLVSVKEIRLRDCNLSAIEMNLFSPTKKLGFLDLGHNEFKKPLSQATLTDLTTLKILLFDNNQLPKLTHRAFANLYLQRLDLSFNRITPIDEFSFQNFTVEELDLSDNLILSLSSKFLLPLAEHLTTLTLARNRLEAIDHKSFMSMPKLKSLDISHNNLNHLSQDTLNGFSSLKSVFLHDNKWVCDYNIKPLISWLAKPENLAKMQCRLSKDRHQECGNLYCAFPLELSKKSLYTLDKDSIKDELSDKDSSLSATAQGAIVAACLCVAIIFLIITIYLWRTGKTGLKLKRVCVPSNAESSHVIDEDSKVPPLSNCDRVSLNESDHEFVVRHYFDTLVTDPKLMSRTSDSEEPKSPKERDSMYSSQPSVYNNEHAPMGIESTV